MILWGWKRCRDEAAYEENPTQELGRIYRLVRKVVDADSEELAHDSIAAELVEKYPDARQEVLVKLSNCMKGTQRTTRFGNNLCRSVVKRLNESIADWMSHSITRWVKVATNHFSPELLTTLLLGDRTQKPRGGDVFLEGYDAPLLSRKPMERFSMRQQILQH